MIIEETMLFDEGNKKSSVVVKKIRRGSRSSNARKIDYSGIGLTLGPKARSRENSDGWPSNIVINEPGLELGGRDFPVVTKSHRSVRIIRCSSCSPEGPFFRGADS